MPRSLLVSACLVLAASLPALAVEPLKPTEKWIETQVDNFRFISAVSPAETRRIARDMLRFRAAAGRVTDFNIHAAEPTRVFVFPTQARFTRYCAALRPSKTCDAVGGMLLDGKIESAILLPADSPAGIDRLVYHELAHLLLVNTNSRLPLWLNEGLAEYFSTFRTAGTSVHLGNPIEEHIRFLASARLLPLRELFAVTNSSPLYNEQTRGGIVHAQSWAFVHYLIHDTDRRVRLARFISLHNDGKRADDAFREAFGMPFSAIEESLGEYIRAASFTVYAVPLGELAIPDVPEPKAMTHDAVLYQLGQLLSHNPGSLPFAERFLKASLAANDANAGAHGSLAQLYQLTGRAAAADAAFARVAELGSDDAAVHLRAGQVLLERGLDSFLKARPFFARATELAPNSPAAWTGLGATYIVETSNRAPGVAALEKSLKLDPNNDDTAFYLAQLLTHDGRRHRDVRKLTTTLLERLTDETTKELVRTMHVIATINGAIDMANAGQRTEALALIDATLPTIRDAQVKREALAAREMIAAAATK